MPTDQSSRARHSDWFLIALDGDMVIKLGDSLVIGEDDAGDLMLNPEHDQGLIRLTVSARELQLQILALEMTLRQKGLPSVQYLSFERPESIRLNFPNNSLIVASEFAPGARPGVQREIALVPTGTPTLVMERLREPIIIVEEPQQATGEVEASDESLPDDIMELIEDPADDPLRWQAGIESDVPDESGDFPVETSIDSPTAAPIHVSEGQLRDDPALEQRPSEIAGQQQSGTPGTAATPRPARRIRLWLRWILIAVLLLAVVPLPLQWAGRDLGVLSSPAMDAVQSLLGPASGPAEQSAPLDSEAADRPITEPQTGADGQRAVDPAPPPQATSKPDLPAPDPIRERQADSPAVLETLLMEAQRLYSSGAIVAPVEYNAVGLLERILYTDPTNERALELMYQCATRMLNRARAARAGGNEYAARNLVEEVLGFHPDFPEAHQLLESWSQPSQNEVDGAGPGRQESTTNP
jgi:hypothetical protein